MKIILPAQNVKLETESGIDTVWYEKLQQLAAFANLFSAIDPTTLSSGQVLIWDSAQKKFIPGAN